MSVLLFSFRIPQVRCFDVLRRLATWVCFGLMVSATLGCSCDEEDEEDLTRPPAPLVDKGVPGGLGVEIYPVVGATDARPVSLVFAGPQVCQKAKAALGARSHVLCSHEQASSGERMKKALAYLKKTYPRHVAGPPSAVLTDPARAELGWRLALAEPEFFSRLYLPGLPRKVLTATTLSALTAGQAKLLLLTGQADKRLDFLSHVSRRRGLQVVALGDEPAALDGALRRILSDDPRLSPPKADVK